MKKCILILFPIIFLSSCVFVGGKRVRGNGNVTSENRSISGFSGVRSAGSFDVYIATGDQAVRIEAESNLLPYIETELEGDVLRIKTREGYRLRPRRGVKVYVTSPGFRQVRLFGSGDIIGQNKITHSEKIELGLSGSGDINVEVSSPEVTAEISGSGNIKLAGQTRKFEGEVNGSGDIKAMDLKTEETKIDIAGSGNADVYASVKLTVDVRGSGDVRYKGGVQQVSSDIKGSGSVRKVD